MTSKLQAPDGTIIDLNAFFSEREAVKALQPHFDAVRKKYPYKPTRRLTDEELNIFKLRLLIKKWFLLDHRHALVGVISEKREEKTSDWVEEAGPNVDETILTSIITQNSAPLNSIEKALVRCENKTYAIGRDGHLIDLDRMWVVPHTSESINQKYMSKQYA